MFKQLGTVVISMLIVGGFASAQTDMSFSKRISEQKKQEMLNHNINILQSGQLLSTTPNRGLAVKRPVAEYEDAGYLMFYDRADFYSADVKAKLVENLPKGVTVVIYSDSDDKKELEGIYAYYSKLAPTPEQVKVIHIPNEPTYRGQAPTGFWSRDAIPVPVIQVANINPRVALSEKFTVVDAKYYHDYEPDQLFADYFSAGLLSHNFYFEGGNFMANSKGDCFVINTEATDIVPNSIFSKTYGCSNLVRLPYLKGIGHADESVKFVSDDHVLTDHPKYKQILEGKGFKVTMLPKPKRDLETYVNSLIINDTVFVPVYKQKTDAEAIKVYKDLGFKVVPADTSLLSNEGAGSIHCTTMTYPSTVSFNELMAFVGSKNVVDRVSTDSKVARKVRELEDERQDHLDRLNSGASLESYLDTLY